MSNVSRRAPLSTATSAANALVRTLEPACVQIEIAGSIRRQQDTVGDIELVAIPKLEEGRGDGQLFCTGEVNLLHQLTGRLVMSDGHQDFTALASGTSGRKPAWGNRLRRFGFHHLNRWFVVDLHITSPERFGCLMVIRTGPKEFSKRFVTHRRQGDRYPTT